MHDDQVLTYARTTFLETSVPLNEWEQNVEYLRMLILVDAVICYEMAMMLYEYFNVHVKTPPPTSRKMAPPGAPKVSTARRSLFSKD